MPYLGKGKYTTHRNLMSGVCTKVCMIIGDNPQDSVWGMLGHCNCVLTILLGYALPGEGEIHNAL